MIKVEFHKIYMIGVKACYVSWKILIFLLLCFCPKEKMGVAIFNLLAICVVRKSFELCYNTFNWFSLDISRI